MKRSQRDKPGMAGAPRLRALWLGLLLAFVTFAAYARVPAHGFTWWDDHQTLHRNPDFNPPTVEGIARYWAEAEGGLYIPVTYTVWGVLAVLAHGNRLDPIGAALSAPVFHFASVVVHIGSALLVMALLRRLLPAGEEDAGRRKRDWAAFAGAGLYALHPVQVESVAWASGMKDLLFGFFSLLALWQYTAWAQRGRDGEHAPGGMRAYVFALLAAGAGMLSKPTAVVIPVAAFVIDCWLVGRPIRKVVVGATPLVLMAAITAVIARGAQPALHVDAPPLWARPLIVGDALAFYLYKLVLPLWLAVDYGRRPVAVMQTGWFYVAWIVPAALGVAAWMARRAAPHLPAAGLLFVIGALPVLGLLPFEFQGYSTVADHYLYLSMLGPALAAAWVAQRWASARTAMICAAVLSLLWLGTMLQTRHWRDDEALWMHNLDVNPRSFLAYTNLGFWESFHGRPQRAIEMYRRAVALSDDYVNAMAMYSLANQLLRAGEDEEAIEWYGRFIKTAMTVPAAARADAPVGQAYMLMGRALERMGRRDEARAAFERALEQNPNLAAAVEGLERLGPEGSAPPGSAPVIAP